MVSSSSGKNTYITKLPLRVYEKIEIGENCILGEGMKIFDHNHQYTTEPFSVSKTEFNTLCKTRKQRLDWC